MSPSKRPITTEGAVSPAEALRFAAIADAVMRAPMYHAADRESAPRIGTLREKRLHAAIKTYLCPDTTCHERPIDTPHAERRPVADILTGQDLMEVQTGGFYPLRDKIAHYLAYTPYRVTVVHPIPAVRYLSWIDPADGHIISRRRSPKRGRVRDVARELYWLSAHIEDPRFQVRILLLELEEYRLADGWSRDGKRGSNRYERFPTALLGDVTLATPADYAAYFLPEALAIPGENGHPTPFTAADYARLTGIRGKATYSMLKLLTSLGLIREREEKIGRSRAYTVAASTPDPPKSPISVN